MKITFPLMGHTWVAVKGLLEYLGLEVIMPPPTSQRTLSLGVQHSPETACLPFKINIGNLIEAREKGADTFLMIGGVGPCRFGLYAQMEKEILADLKYKYKALIVEPPEKGLLQFFKQVRKIVGPVSWWKVLQAVRLAYYKACLLDKLEKKLQEIRLRERNAGTADKIFQHALNTIDHARSMAEAEEAYSLSRQKMEHIPWKDEEVVLKIGMVGEIFTLLDPFASREVEKKLGALGAYVTRSIYLSDWLEEHLCGGLFSKNILQLFKYEASPFLNHFVGGHGRESIGAAVAFAKAGYDGIVQIAPLTCMPEIVAHTIFPRLSKDLAIPVLTLYVDEQTGEAGIHTRLEAFVELLRQKKACGTHAAKEVL